MTKFLFGGAFALGVLAILWIGRLFLGTDAFGLSITLLIGGVYVIGAWELLTYRRATKTLSNALTSLTSPIDDLNQWLSTINSGLQNPVRLRVAGANNGLPAPVLTPYLVGLLVMLGLLGTFIGMVDTLKGAVVALEGTSELEAIRAGLAAPIEGLGLAFGTSVAGVATSAMLGLLSTLSRRQRLQASQLLDAKVGSELHHFSDSYQQRLAFQAMQDQAQALPAVAEQLSTLSNELGKMSIRVEQRLLTNQEQFQSTISHAYRELSESVDQAIKNTLVESTDTLQSHIQPMAEAAFAQFNETSIEAQAHLSTLSEQQLTALGEAMLSNNSLIREALENSFEQQKNSTETLLERVNDAVFNTTSEMQKNTESLLENFSDTSDKWVGQQQLQSEQFGNIIRDELGRLRDEEHQRGTAAIERLSELEAVVTTHLTALAKGIEEPMTDLIETASQTPKAAADVIQKLREEITKNTERDNELLSERTRLLEQLDSASNAVSQSSLDQQKAIDSLVEQSADALSQVGSKFSDLVENESSKLAQVTEQFATSSAEMASLGDAFDTAVNIFGESNRLLIENLTRIEASLEQSSQRSDEQLGYYVNQAREIIDHSLLSHREIIDALRAQQPAVAKSIG